MGTTNEVLVNTYVKHIQGAPDVACNNDGVVVVWESYDAEEYNYDPDPANKTDLHDYGVACRVFNYAGEPVYVMGDVMGTIDTGYDKIEVAVKKNPGTVLSRVLGEFVINTTTTGDQFAPSVAVFDWINDSTTGLAVPRFVVAWAGPNAHAAAELEPRAKTTTSGTGQN